MRSCHAQRKGARGSRISVQPVERVLTGPQPDQVRQSTPEPRALVLLERQSDNRRTKVEGHSLARDRDGFLVQDVDVTNRLGL